MRREGETDPRALSGRTHEPGDLPSVPGISPSPGEEFPVASTEVVMATNTTADLYPRFGASLAVAVRGFSDPPMFSGARDHA